jgi:hypothetical protein
MPTKKLDGLPPGHFARPPDAGGIGLRVDVRMKRMHAGPQASHKAPTCFCFAGIGWNRKGKGRAEVQGPSGAPCCFRGRHGARGACRS